MLIFSKKILEGKHQIIKNYMHTTYFPVPYVVEGENSLPKLVSAMNNMYILKVFIIASRSVLATGNIDIFLKTLTKSHIEYFIYSDVSPNPTSQDVKNAYSKLLKHGGDAIVAIGGGSVIDCAKVVSLQANNPKHSVKQLNSIVSKLALRTIKRGLPIFVAPTTSGSGSEVTNSAVIGLGNSMSKTPIVSNKFLPKWIALDPNLLTSMPRSITVNSGLDALSHAVESYISVSATTKSQKYSAQATKLIFQNLKKTDDEPDNHKYRLAMADASLKAGLAFRIGGVGYTHALSHTMTTFYGISHGESNAIILPYVLEFSFSEVYNKLAELSIRIGLGNPKKSNIALAKEFIGYLKKFNNTLGVPSQIAPLKLEDISSISKKSTREANNLYTVPKLMTKTECKKLLLRMIDNDINKHQRVRYSGL